RPMSVRRLLGDDAAAACDLLHPLVGRRLHGIDVAQGVHRDIDEPVELSIPGAGGAPGQDEAPIVGELLYAAVIGVRDVDAAVRADRYAKGIDELPRPGPL